MPSPLPSAPAPLFDRLCAPAGSEAEPLDARGLRESLARELGLLLGTRSRLPLSRYAAEADTVLDWGLPDFTALSPRSGDDREALREAVEVALARFEPRLRQVQVAVDDWPGQPQRARVQIDAAVRLGTEWRRVRFALPADGADAPGEA